MGKIAYIVLVVVLSWLAKLVYDAGDLRYEPYYSTLTKCSNFTGIAITEEMSLDKETGNLFMASAELLVGLFRGVVNVSYPAGLYRIDLNEDEPVIHTLEVIGFDQSKAMYHGNDIYRTKDGTVVFMVVNHPRDEISGLPRHLVEIFHYKDQKMYHQETISTEHMLSINDIAAVGPRSFYLSNDHFYTRANPVLHVVEDIWRFSWSNVIYFNGNTNKSSIAADKIASSNGVALSVDGKKVYIAATVGKEIRIYNRYENNSLSLESVQHIHDGPDNIYVDSKNILWISVHPKLLTAYAAIYQGILDNAPSKVIRLEPTDTTFSTFEEKNFYHGDGTEIAALTSAVRYKNKVALSGLLTNTVMVCEFVDSK